MIVDRLLIVGKKYAMLAGFLLSQCAFMPSKKVIITLAFLSISPLLFSVALSLYSHMIGTGLSAYTLNFAGINTYIYAHSYAALLLCVVAGIQLGLIISKGSQTRLTAFYLLMLPLSWFSQASFANLSGMVLLLCCWVATGLVETTQSHLPMPQWYRSVKLKMNVVVVLMLVTLMLVNQ